MEFLKKYKVLAVGGGIALLLLIVAGVFLYFDIQKYAADTGEADANQTRLGELENRKPAGPTAENVQIVASNAVIKETCLKRLLLNLRQGQVEPRKDMQRVVFNSFLKATIDQMNEAVKQQGMLVPAKFDYGFKTYYSEGKLPAPGDVPRLTVQVQLVKVLLDMLLQARITEVVSVERQLFDDTSAAGAAVGAAAQPAGEGRGRAGTAVGAATGGAVTPYPLDPPDAQGLFTREHFTLSLKATDERLADLLNLLAHSKVDAQPRLFAVVTKLDIVGVSMAKVGGVEAEGGARTERAPAVSSAPAGEGTGAASDKPIPPKRREERVVSGKDLVTVQLDVDIYRFAADTKEKAKP